MDLLPARKDWRISSTRRRNDTGKREKHRCKIKSVVLSAMKMMLSEDLNRERLNWLIEHVDEMFSDMDENENET